MKVPARLAAVGEWFTKKWHTPKIDGKIGSPIGDRNGEVFSGKYFQGDGVGYVSLPNGEFTNQSYSGCVWFKPGNSNNGVLFGQDTDGAFWGIQITSSNTVKILYRSDASNSNFTGTYEDSTVLDPDTWYHVAVSVEWVGAFSCNLKLYLNSSLILDVQTFFKTDWDSSAVGDSNRLGGLLSRTGIGHNISNAGVWNFQYYNRALSDGEVSEIYEKYEPLKGVNIFHTCEILYGVKSYDSSGLGFHGDMVDIDSNTFHKESTGIPYSFLNSHGYSDGKGVDIQSFYPITSSVANGLDGVAGENYVETLEHTSGNTVSFNHDAEGGVPVVNGYVDKFGWHDDKYYVSSSNNAGGSTIIHLPGAFGASKVKLKGQSFGCGLNINIRDTTIYQNFLSIINPLFGTGAYNAFSSTEEFFYSISGTHPTYGDSYPSDFLGYSGVTSTTLRGFLVDSGIVESTIPDFIDSVEERISLVGNEVGIQWYYFLCPTAVIVLIDNGYTGEFDIVRDLGYDSPTGGLGGKNADYWIYNSNYSFRQISSTHCRALGISNHPNNPLLQTFVFYSISIEEEHKIPFNFLDRFKDAIGSKLDYPGRVRIPAQLTQSNCLKGDSVMYVEIAQDNTYTLKSFDFVFYSKGNSDQSLLGSGHNGNFLFWIQGDRTSYRYRWNGSGYFPVLPSTLQDGDYCTVKVEVLDETVLNVRTTFINHTQGWESVFEDGGRNDSVSASKPFFGLLLAYYSDTLNVSRQSNCKLFNIKGTTNAGAEDFIIPLAEGAGTSIHIINLTTGVVTVKGIIDGTYPDVWDKQDYFHWNAIKGYSKSGILQNPDYLNIQGSVSYLQQSNNEVSVSRDNGVITFTGTGINGSTVTSRNIRFNQISSYIFGLYPGDVAEFIVELEVRRESGADMQLVLPDVSDLTASSILSDENGVIDAADFRRVNPTSDWSLIRYTTLGSQTLGNQNTLTLGAGAAFMDIGVIYETALATPPSESIQVRNIKIHVRNNFGSIPLVYIPLDNESTPSISLEKTRELDLDTESKVSFVECPEVRSVGLDPDSNYSFNDLQSFGNSKVFAGQSNGRGKKIVAYSKTNQEIIDRAEKYTKT